MKTIITLVLVSFLVGCDMGPSSQVANATWQEGLGGHMASFVVYDETGFLHACGATDTESRLVVIAEETLRLSTYRLGVTETEEDPCLTVKSLEGTDGTLQKWVLYHVLVTGPDRDEKVQVEVLVECDGCLEFLPSE